MKDLYKILEELEITFQEYEHPPVITVEDAEIYWKDIEAMPCKNLFLRNNKGNKHFLLIMPHNKGLDMKSFQEKLGEGRLSFASEKRLDKYLALERGAVSPFGLIHDTKNHVKVVIDNEVKIAKNLAFHPNINTQTITITFADFEKLLEATNNEYQYLEI